MKEYIIKRIDGDLNWDNVAAAAIDTAMWLPNPDICAKAQLAWDDEALYVRLSAKEANVRAENTSPLGMPCEDSCLEFFFSPLAGDPRYFNIEYNPKACVFLGIGYNRY